MAEVFVRKTNGAVLGPIQSSQLKGMIAAKSLTPEDALSKSKDGPWMTAANVKGLVFPQAGKRTQTDQPPTRANEADATSISDTLIVSGETIKVFKYAHILSGALYCAGCQPDTLTLSRRSIDSTHLAKADIINPTLFELYCLIALAASWLTLGLFITVNFLFPFLTLIEGPIWIFRSLAVWVACIAALIALYFKLMFNRKYFYILKLNTSAIQTLIPFATREEGERAVELLTAQ